MSSAASVREEIRSVRWRRCRRAGPAALDDGDDPFDELQVTDSQRGHDELHASTASGAGAGAGGGKGGGRPTPRQLPVCWVLPPTVRATAWREGRRRQKAKGILLAAKIIYLCYCSRGTLNVRKKQPNTLRELWHHERLVEPTRSHHHSRTAVQEDEGQRELPRRVVEGNGARVKT